MTSLCEVLERIAVDAGEAILGVYDAGPNVCYKTDQSPVTEADFADPHFIAWADMSSLIPY